MDDSVAVSAQRVPTGDLGLDLRSLVLTWRLGLPLFDGLFEIDIDPFGVLILLRIEALRHAALRLVDWRGDILFADVGSEFLFGYILNGDLWQVLHD